MPALLTRDAFRAAVFARDANKCVICGQPCADAHHIIERRLWEDEGYYLDNGASLCPAHHIQAEQTVLSCEAIREAAGIIKPLLPPDFYDELSYDKWGNPVMDNGQRMRGELFFDTSVQHILESGGVLDQFSKYVKYPRTWHLPWSASVVPGKDRVLTAEQVATRFNGYEVVVTEKLDGENTTMYNDYVHARSADSGNHPGTSWAKNYHAQIGWQLPESWRVCGENLFAKHSIHYNGLASFFVVFAIFDEAGTCLSWDDTVMIAGELGMTMPPVLYRGPYDEAAVKQCYTGKSRYGTSVQEGYVMRKTEALRVGFYQTSIAKYVRPGHVQTTHHWAREALVRNTLA